MVITSESVVGLKIDNLDLHGVSKVFKGGQAMFVVEDSQVDSKDRMSDIFVTKNSLNILAIICASLKCGNKEILFRPKSLSTISNSFFLITLALVNSVNEIYSSLAFLIKALTCSQLSLYLDQRSVDLSFLQSFSHFLRFLLQAKISSLIQGCVRR